MFYIMVMKFIFLTMALSTHLIGATASHEVLHAIEMGDRQFILGYLTGHGEVNAVDHKNRSLLQRAAARGHGSIVSDLIIHNAHVDYEDDAGNTALYMATLKNHEECVRLLLTAGATVTQADGRWVTALHTACHKGHTDVAKLCKRNRWAVDLWITCLKRTFLNCRKEDISKLR